MIEKTWLHSFRNINCNEFFNIYWVHLVNLDTLVIMRHFFSFSWNVQQITKLVFKLICLVLTTFMSITQVLRYIDNNDKASVTVRRFNHSQRDRYPTYNICFENQNLRGEFYNQTYLINKFGINGSDYFQMISGLDVYGYLPKSSMLSDIDFELASIHPKEIIREYFARYNKGKHCYVKSQLNKNLKVKYFFFYC